MYKGSLAIAGECMSTRPFSMHDEPDFLELIKILQEADTTYCHLEMNLHKKGGYPARAFSATALRADPIIADELKWAGIDLVSCAYNHALDWGLPGLFGTMASLDTAGLIHAGTGINLGVGWHRDPCMGFSKHAAPPKNSGLTAFRQFGPLLRQALKNPWMWLNGASPPPGCRLSILQCIYGARH